MSNWHEQWNRVKRYYERFSKFNYGIEGHGEPSDYHYDDMLAFFLNCFHLKDWLTADNFKSIKMPNISPEEYLENSECLSICADLANGLKHMKLDRRLKSGSKPELANRGMSITGGSPFVILKANVKYGDKMIDAFELATQCIVSWNAYI